MANRKPTNAKIAVLAADLAKGLLEEFLACGDPRVRIIMDSEHEMNMYGRLLQEPAARQVFEPHGVKTGTAKFGDDEWCLLLFLEGSVDVMTEEEVQQMGEDLAKAGDDASPEVKDAIVNLHVEKSKGKKIQ